MSDDCASVETLPPDWLVARLKPLFAADRRAETHARELGLEPYVPRYRKRVVVNGRVSRQIALYFPGYMFVLSSAAYLVRSLRCVAGLVEFDDKPAVLPPHEIARIRAKHDAEGFVRVPRESAECFSPGQHVRVQSGQMTGLTGIYDGMSARGREVLLMQVLGAYRRCELAEETALVAA